MTPVRMSWRAVLAGRLRRQHLLERVPASRALEVVSDLGGLHAQVMSSAELTLAARVEGLPNDAVARLLWDERRLVKTWAVRGTLHLLAADEFPMWVAALSTYRHFTRPSWQKAFVPLDQLEQIITTCGEVLDGQLLTREQLADAVAQRTGSVELGEALRSGWGALLKPAAFRGRICFGPGDGQLVRFTRPDTWLGDVIGAWPEVDPEEALRTLVRRHLRVQGPLGREDISRWLALPPARVGRLLAALGDDVVPVEVEGTTLVGLATLVSEDLEREPAVGAPPVVRLLPAFDQYVVAGMRGAEAVLPAEHRPRVFRPQGWLSPVLLVDGRIEGTWRHERRRDRVEVTLEPFRAQSPAVVAGVEAEARRLGRYLEAEPTLTWT